MLYPVYVHLGDADHAHGVTVPDFPGCFSAADEWQDLPKAVQEAVEVYCENETLELPAPSPLEKLTADPDYQGGAWLLVDIDTDRLDAKTVRVNVTLPLYLLRKIDDYAKAHGQSRSGFLAKAAKQSIGL